MDIQRMTFGIFLLLISVFVSWAGVYSLNFVKQLQDKIKKITGIAPSFDERQMKMMGYILPVGFILLGLIVMVGSLYMIYEAIYFAG